MTPSKLAAWLRDERALGRLAFALPLVAFVVVYLVEGTGRGPSGDGFYSWIFTRSLVFDFDVELRNDYALCGDPFGVGIDRGTGHPDNPFYVGPAVFWAAPLAVLRIASTLFVGAARAASASCHGWLPELTILAGPVCGALTVWLSFRAAALLVPPRIAAFTALLFAFSSPLFPYATSVGHYSHVYLTCCVAGLVYVSLRIIVSGFKPRDALLVAACMAVAVLHRLPALLYALLPATTLVLTRTSLGARARMAIATALGGALGAGLTSALYVFLYGRWFAVPQGPDYVHFAHAHPWLVLFGVHGGFFFWMPAAWLAVAGLLVAVTRRPDLRWFVFATVLVAALENFISSAPVDWHGNWSLGARRLLPLTPLVVVFAALAIEKGLGRAPAVARRASSLGVLVVVHTLVNNVPASLSIRGDKELGQRELYGALSPLRPMWSALDALGVDLALLPAEAFFSLRYGLPPSSYREVIRPRYRRNYRDLTFAETELDLRLPASARIATGASWSDRGLTFGADEGRVVFTTEWPFATHVRLRIEGPPGSTLQVEAATGVGKRTPIGAVVVLEHEPSWVELPLGPATFRSGINEFALRTDEPGRQVVVSTIALEDRTPRTPYGWNDQAHRGLGRRREALWRHRGAPAHVHEREGMSAHRHFCAVLALPAAEPCGTRHAGLATHER